MADTHQPSTRGEWVASALAFAAALAFLFLLVRFTVWETLTYGSPVRAPLQEKSAEPETPAPRIDPQELEEARAAHQTAKAKADVLQGQVAKLLSEAEEREATLATLRAKADATSAEGTDPEADPGDEIEAPSEPELEPLRSEIERLTDESKAKEKLLEETKTSLAQMEKSLAESEKATSEAKEATAEVEKAAGAALKELEDKLAKALKDLEERETLAEESEKTLEEKLAKALEELDSATTEQKALAEARDQAEAERKTAEAERKTAEAKVRVLEEKAVGMARVTGDSPPEPSPSGEADGPEVASGFAESDDDLDPGAADLLRRLKKLHTEDGAEGFSDTLSAIESEDGIGLLKRVPFGSGVTSLADPEIEDLRELAKEAGEGSLFFVVAYTDTTGTEEQNREVAQKRALGVSNAIAEVVSNLQAAYVGSTDRFDKEELGKNRVVEIWTIAP